MFFERVILNCGHFADQENTYSIWEHFPWPQMEGEIVNSLQDAAWFPHRKQDSPHIEDEHVWNATSV